MLVRLESAHTTKKEDYQLVSAADRKTSKFILAVVEDTWVCKLRDPDLFYTAVKPRALLDHLRSMCIGFHAMDVLNLKNEMQTYHEDMEGIPEYINKLEDAQKQSNRVVNPFTDPTLLFFAANGMLHTNCFPCANEKWEDLASADRNWIK